MNEPKAKPEAEAAPAPAPPTNRPIVFYDGQCGLCDRSVRWILDRDTHARLRFAPLQGETYAALDEPSKPTDLGTIVFRDDRGLHVRSDAVLRILHHLGGLWRPLAAIARVIPRPIRDAAYRFIAARRLKWFGGPEACKMPTAKERSQLLP